MMQDHPSGSMELLIKPVDVGSLGVQAEDGLAREPWAMTVTIAPDAVPHLREAFERNASGHLLDTTTQWHTLTHEDPGVSPLTFLRVELPEFGLVFNIGFSVDECKRSLAVAARTGRVLLIEPAVSKSMRLESPWTAMREPLSIGLSAPGVEPLRRALAQRVAVAVTEQTVTREEPASRQSPAALEESIKGATNGRHTLRG